MYTKAYWIDRKGKLIKLTATNHILQVIKEPKKFGVTREYLEKTFEKHNERFGSEGDAREEIILKLLSHGFIRIREYRTHWSVTVDNMSKMTKNALSNWAEIEQVKSGQHTPVKINVVKTNKLIKVDELKKVWYGLYENLYARIVKAV